MLGVLNAALLLTVTAFLQLALTSTPPRRLMNTAACRRAPTPGMVRGREDDSAVGGRDTEYGSSTGHDGTSG